MADLPALIRVTIERLGHRGDGIAISDGRTFFVAGALPGEIADIDPAGGERAQLVSIIEPSAHRVAPPCIHFATCGGCVAQHMDGRLYDEWKRDSITTALGQQGISVPLEAMVRVEPGTRRRVTLALVREGKTVTFGFHGARSNNVIAITACLVMTPAIAAALPALARLLSPLITGRDSLAVSVLDTAQGLDVSLAPAKLPRDAMSRLFAAAGAIGLARLSIGEENATFRPPSLPTGEIARLQPAAGFAQAVAPVEEAIAGLAKDALSGARRIIELFCGSGALTLRLARHMAIHAVEGDLHALAALDQTVRHASGLKPVTREQRDLFRRPLLVSELKNYDAALLDPPRQGAQAQMAGLAASKLKKIVYVSCAPASFARDARVLIDGGFRLSRITPIDQFLWSHHVELVGVFER